MLVAIKVVGDGSKDIVQSFDVAVEQRKAKIQATVPVGLRPLKKQKPTYASVRWNPTPGAHGYMLQHCTNQGDPTTFSAPILCIKARYAITGQTPGTTVSFRVLACDDTLPSGQTPCCAWVAVVVTG